MQVKLFPGRVVKSRLVQLVVIVKRSIRSIREINEDTSVTR